MKGVRPNDSSNQVTLVEPYPLRVQDVPDLRGDETDKKAPAQDGMRSLLPEEKEMRKELFFELLHEARRLRSGGWNWGARRGYLMGMVKAYLLHYEDIRSGQNIRDVWKHQQNGAEGG